MNTDARLTPQAVPRVETRYRRMVTDFPVPESLPVLEQLGRWELRAMGGQPPVVWDRAEGFQVYDAWGNQWMDWSSGVVLASAGHGRDEIIEAVCEQARRHLLATYSFPSAIRAKMCERLATLMPEPLKKAFVLTTGSEAVEFVVKLGRIHGQQVGGRNKNVVVSFEKAFHGRTLGAQLTGGIPALKEWAGPSDAGFLQVPFPDGYWTEDTSFEVFTNALAEAGVAPSSVCAVIMETYVGGTAAFAPVEYVRTLQQWCRGHRALLVLDEVQAGFGRTGRLWGFEHYGIVPDLTTLGKGLSSSLPLAAVVGRPELMDLPVPGTASSTHSGNPVCCAAGLANIDLILNERLPENSARVGAVLHDGLRKIQAKHRQAGFLAGKGLVAGLACVKPEHRLPDPVLASAIQRRAVEKGLLMFNPVGPQGCTLKICPPLVITEDAVAEGCAVLGECFDEILG